MAMSPRNRGAPVPSMIVPLAMRRSYRAPPATGDGAVRAHAPMTAHATMTASVFRMIRRESVAQREANSNVRGRDRDRAVEGSPPLEAFDERRRLRIGHAPQLEIELHGIERRYVRPRLLGAVGLAVNLHCHALERRVLFACDHVHQLDAAGGDR